VNSLEIVHFAYHNINIGDGAVVAGIRRHLDAAFPDHRYVARDLIDFAGIDGDASFDAGDLRSDQLVLVGGGGVIDGSSQRIRSGMAFPMSGEELRSTPARMAYVALGYNLFPGRELRCREALADVVAACRERSFPFSVRNDGSLERIREQLGSVADEVVEVPDPGFFVPARPDAEIPAFLGDGSQRPVVVVQLAGDNLKRRMSRPESRPQGWWKRRKSEDPVEAFLDTMAAFVCRLIQEYGARVLIAPHITRDFTITGKLLDRMPQALCRPSVEVMNVTHPRHADYFFEAYRRASLVVGMRGHSVICAVGHRVPCLAISTHDKVGGFMEKCGLSDWSLEPGPELAERLWASTQRLMEDPAEHLAQRDRGTGEFAARFGGFIQSLRSAPERA
jgi:polysaccharide pyruvyl transferase WcaK-like protein